MSIVSKLRQQIAECQEQIESIQSACAHPSVAVHKRPVKIPVTVHYEDEIGAQPGTETRDGFSCSCGLCLSEWTEYENGKKWSPFDQENIGRI